ncbi:MAG: hypothetical protein Q7T36_16680 [Fluviicoccus sp.]|uniref:hypothetical protein n=1 Tax=Fluviicoccus sp. TaxID=2003552 RepID=UPI0027245180|nr:hypothetical protein [Fluviicoccus sp.]MDO8332102.1 hypothetical protein [Fluviicoccus sp.]
MKPPSTDVPHPCTRHQAGLALGSLFVLINIMLYGFSALLGEHWKVGVMMALMFSSPLALASFEFSGHSSRLIVACLCVLINYFGYGYLLGIIFRPRPSFSKAYALWVLTSYGGLVVVWMGILYILLMNFLDF